MKTCPHPECDRTIADPSFACLAHWRILPRRLRAGIDRHRGEDDTRSLATAIRVWQDVDTDSAVRYASDYTDPKESHDGPATDALPRP